MSRLQNYWVEQAKWWTSRSLEWWAVHITAVYIGGAITIMGAKFDELILLKLNEIGDLSAGIFGPVAFLWLVLGYVQQGRELKLSSEALQLQAKELNESVQQQVKLVDIAQKQLAAEQEGFQHTRALYESTQIPDLRIESMAFGAGGSLDGNSDVFNFEFYLINFGGATASQVEGVYTFLGKTKLLFSGKDISKKGIIRHREELPGRPKSGLATFKFIYSYGDGVSGAKTIEVNFADRSPMYPVAEIYNETIS